ALLKRAPGPVDQLLAPDRHEIFVFDGCGGLPDRNRDLVLQRLKARAAPAPPLVDQVIERRLEVIAEPAAIRVGVAKVSLQEVERKLRVELVGTVRISRSTQQIPVDRRAIPFEDLGPRETRLTIDALLRSEKRCPRRGDLAQVAIHLDSIHSCMISRTEETDPSIVATR